MALGRQDPHRFSVAVVSSNERETLKDRLVSISPVLLALMAKASQRELDNDSSSAVQQHGLSVDVRDLP